MFFRTLILSLLLLGLMPTPPAALAADSKPYTEEEKPRTSWLPGVKPKKSNPADQFEYAAKLYKNKKLKKAAKQFQKLVLFWPNTDQAAEAQLMYATIQQQRGKYEKAFYAYQKLIDDYESKFEYSKLLERQFEIAKAVMTKKHATFLLLSGYERPSEAIPYLEQIVENGPRWKHAAEAQYLVGGIRELEKEYELAIPDYMNTMLSYPNSRYAEQAAFGRCRCLMKLAEQSPNDIDAAESAWYALTVFKATYPDSEHKELVEAYLKESYYALAKQSYDVAVFYDQNTSKPKAALLSYEDFVERFPSSEWTPRARERIQVLSQLVEQQSE